MANQSSNDWFVGMARREADFAADFGAGRHQFGEPETEAPIAVESDPHKNVVFGKFVQLSRRRQGLSRERLAERADIDLGDLIEIEEDASHIAEPRTVYQLAEYFDVPTRPLLQIAGLTVARDSDLLEEGVRFAARSGSMDVLTRDERQALEAFVAYLEARE